MNTTPTIEMECAVATCKNYWRKTKDTEHVIYHRFPNNKEIAKIWLFKCKRADTVNIVNARVCSVHFDNEDYLRDLQHELLGLPPRKKRRLKPDAVPHLFLPDESACRTSGGNEKISQVRINRF